MALAPGDLALRVNEFAEADRLEVYIDTELRVRYVPGNKVSILLGSTSQRIKNELIRRYKAAGWEKVECTINNTIDFEQ